MNISVMQENLARGLSTVSRAVSSRATLPVLANVLLRTEDSGLKLTATNLEIGINCWVPGKVNAEGAITVPAKLFTDLVASLPNQRIDLELSTKDRTLRLTCGGSRASIFARDSANIVKIALGAEDGEGPVKITAHAADVGDNDDAIEGSLEGSPTTIAFNARYLIEVLSNLGADEAALELSGPLAPGVIRGIGKDDYVHVIMPVRTAS
jgi:DNA polymerase-3 subunit beta